MENNVNTQKNFNPLLIIMLPLALIIVLTGCTRTNNPVNNTNTAEQTMKENASADVKDGHIGCQEDEIGIDGTCSVAFNNNTTLFDQDLDSLVDSEEIDNGAKGFIASPKEPGQYPGVVMIHEWWGLNDNIREMAKLLAKEGYIVFAIDLYGVEAATEFDQARVLATAVRTNQDKAIADMKAATDYLTDRKGVDQLASIGWCFGGQQSLLLSLNQPIDATVIYYGQLTDDQNELKNIAGPVLGLFGEADTSIPVESVKSFETALNDLSIQNEIYIYDGLGHAFANPSGTSYAPEQTKDAWNKTLSFLERSLKNN